MKPGHVESPQGLAVQSVCFDVISVSEVVFSNRLAQGMPHLIHVRRVRATRNELYSQPVDYNAHYDTTKPDECLVIKLRRAGAHRDRR
jgi:hypothetical protein